MSPASPTAADDSDARQDATPASPRNLLILCDGTGNELGRNLSNVLKLYRIAQKNARQIVYYHPGVGTISRISPWRRFSQKASGVLGLATGYGLAIDERRRMFRVAHWKDGQTYQPNPFSKAKAEPQDCRQVWFAGVHSDIGGGYPETESALSKIPLLWMIEEARALGLRINPSMLHHLVHGKPRKGSKHEYVAPDPLGPIHDSMSGAWPALEYLPKRSEYQEWPRSSWQGWYLPKCEPRSIPEGHEVHESVYERMGAGVGYGAVNVPKASSSG